MGLDAETAGRVLGNAPVRSAWRPTAGCVAWPRWIGSGVRNTNRAFDAEGNEMARDREPRMDAATAERLLSGDGDGPSPLAELIAAAAAPPHMNETAGE